MAKAKYVITNEDYPLALTWVRNKKKTDHLFLYYADNTTRALTSLDKIIDAESLDIWCNKYLNMDDWEKLKNAIRAAKKRLRDRVTDKKKSITITSHAWIMLSTIADKKGLTLSEVIEKDLKSEYIKALNP